MSLKHAKVWQAIDRLAEMNGMTPSGLALAAGLSSTAFNPSKRIYGKRKRWPSTESISDILRATNTTFEEFVALTASDGHIQQKTLPMLSSVQIKGEGLFDEMGHPLGKNWEGVNAPAINDPHAFVIEIVGDEYQPIYREGDRLVVSSLEKPRRADRVVVRTNSGEVFIKQLGRQNAQKTELLPLSGNADILDIATRDIEWMYRIIWTSQ